MVVSAVEAVLQVVIFVAVGFFVARAGWTQGNVRGFLSKFVINVTLPCTLFSMLINNFDSESLAKAPVILAVAFASVWGFYLLEKFVIAPLFKIKKERRGVFVSESSCSNTMLVGLPLTLTIFGEEGFVYFIFFYLANTMLVNIPCFLEIQKDGEIRSGTQKQKLTAGKILKPAMFAIALGFIFIAANIGLPEFADDIVGKMGAVTTPVSLVMVGIVLYDIGFANLKPEKDVVALLVSRFVLAPLCMFLITTIAGLDATTSLVLIVQAGLPCFISAVMFSELCGADSGFAAKGVIWTTIVSIAAIPLYVLILGIG